MQLLVKTVFVQIYRAPILNCLGIYSHVSVLDAHVKKNR